MCLILLAWRAHPDFPLVVLANRDEFHERPTDRAGFWADEPQLLAGRDQRGGGTWLGLTRRGRFAAITNVREPNAEATQGQRSRGLLVRDFLLGAGSPEAFAEETLARGSEYAGFNLIVGDQTNLLCVSNRRGAGGGAANIESAVDTIEPGVHAVSNGRLDEPWPKVARGTAELRTILEEETVSVECALVLLADRTLPSDSDLPDTGVGVELERELAPIFVSTPLYGTRSSTVLTVGSNGDVVFVEFTFDENGRPAGSRGCAFSLDA